MKKHLKKKGEGTRKPQGGTAMKKTSEEKQKPKGGKRMSQKAQRSTSKVNQAANLSKSIVYTLKKAPLGVPGYRILLKKGEDVKAFFIATPVYSEAQRIAQHHFKKYQEEGYSLYMTINPVMLRAGDEPAKVYRYQYLLVDIDIDKAYPYWRRMAQYRYADYLKAILFILKELRIHTYTIIRTSPKGNLQIFIPIKAKNNIPEDFYKRTAEGLARLFRPYGADPAGHFGGRLARVANTYRGQSKGGTIKEGFWRIVPIIKTEGPKNSFYYIKRIVWEHTPAVAEPKITDVYRQLSKEFWKAWTDIITSLFVAVKLGYIKEPFRKKTITEVLGPHYQDPRTAVDRRRYLVRILEGHGVVINVNRKNKKIWYVLGVETFLTNLWSKAYVEALRRKEEDKRKFKDIIFHNYIAVLDKTRKVTLEHARHLNLYEHLQQYAPDALFEGVRKGTLVYHVFSIHHKVYAHFGFFRVFLGSLRERIAFAISMARATNLQSLLRHFHKRYPNLLVVLALYQIDPANNLIKAFDGFLWGPLGPPRVGGFKYQGKGIPPGQGAGRPPLKRRASAPGKAWYGPLPQVGERHLWLVRKVVYASYHWGVDSPAVQAVLQAGIASGLPPAEVAGVHRWAKKRLGGLVYGNARESRGN